MDNKPRPYVVEFNGLSAVLRPVPDGVEFEGIYHRVGKGTPLPIELEDELPFANEQWSSGLRGMLYFPNRGTSYNLSDNGVYVVEPEDYRRDLAGEHIELPVRKDLICEQDLEDPRGQKTILDKLFGKIKPTDKEEI